MAKMKKFLAFIMAFVMMLVLCSGCTISIATRKSKLVGTYKLTTLTDYAGDMIGRKGIEAYLVVPESGRGYYVYKDNDTPVSVRYADIIFHPDEEKPNRYSQVEYAVDGDEKSYKCGNTGGALNYSELGFKSVKPIETYWKSTAWTREDRAQDLSYVEDQLGDLPEVIPYGLAKYDGYYVYSGYYIEQGGTEFYDEFSERFVYAILDVDAAAGKATAYYMLKSDMLSREAEYPAQVTSTAITVDDQTYELNNVSRPRMIVPAQFTASSSTVYDFTYEFARYERKEYSLQRNIDALIEQFVGENG